MLAIENLQAGYGGTPVIDGLTLAPFEAGTVTGLLGANGAGKSTILKAIAGMIRHHGSVSVNGRPVSEMTRRERALAIGYLPQTLPIETSLVSWEAVLGACRAVRPDLTRRQAEHAAQVTFDRLGISHLAMQAMNALSGGQRQMIGLAQTIVREPPVMLLDEPTSALDLRWQLGVFDVIRRIANDRGTCGIIAIHDINLALRHCDRIVVLRDGSVIADGSPEVAMSSGILRDAYDVDGRIERCTRGSVHIIADRVSQSPGDAQPTF